MLPTATELRVAEFRSKLRVTGCRAHPELCCIAEISCESSTVLGAVEDFQRLELRQW